MSYSPQGLVHYLLSRALLAPREILSGDVTVITTGGANSAFRVLRRGNAGWFVKQFDELPARKRAFQAECAFLRAAARLEDLSRHVPVLAVVDENRQLFVVELLAGTGPNYPALPIDEMALLGRALSVLHENSSNVAAGLAIDLPRRTHFTFRLEGGATADDQIDETFFATARRNRQLVRQLTALNSEWSFDGIIHGDLKWDNCILVRNAGDAEVIIVDWEQIRFGDFAWDIAGALQDAWVRWIVSMPLDAEKSPSAERALLPFEDLSAAIRSFWAGYCDHRKLDAAERSILWTKAVRYSAARLVQTALERARVFGIGFETVSFLQIAENILNEPGEAGMLLHGEAK